MIERLPGGQTKERVAWLMELMEVVIKRKTMINSPTPDGSTANERSRDGREVVAGECLQTEAV